MPYYNVFPTRYETPCFINVCGNSSFLLTYCSPLTFNSILQCTDSVLIYPLTTDSLEASDMRHLE